MHGSMSGVGKRSILATAPNLDSTQAAKKLEAQDCQTGQKMLSFIRFLIFSNISLTCTYFKNFKNRTG